MKFRHLAVAAALLAALPAFAHNPKSSHGGRIVLAGPYHVELVAKDKAIEISSGAMTTNRSIPRATRASPFSMWMERPNASRSLHRKRTR
jgi:hypothetical protein